MRLASIRRPCLSGCGLLYRRLYRLPAQARSCDRCLGGRGSRPVRLVAAPRRSCDAPRAHECDAVARARLRRCYRSGRVDVSFTSIANIIDAVLSCLKPSGSFCTLVKPQFEAPAALVGEGGIVTDPAVRHDTLVAAVELFAAKACSRSMSACRPFMVPRETLSFPVRHEVCPGERADDELQSQVSVLSEKAATL